MNVQIEAINRKIHELEVSKQRALVLLQADSFDYNKEFLEAIRLKYPTYDDLLKSNIIPLRIKKYFIAKKIYEEQKGKRSQYDICRDIGAMMNAHELTVRKWIFEIQF